MSRPAGFPHSDIHGSQPAFGFPWLFVDRYVLHRLPVPRHPPCALCNLTYSCGRCGLRGLSIVLESLLGSFICMRPVVQAHAFFPRAFRRFGFTSHFLLRFFIQFSRYDFQLLLQLLVGSNGLEPSTSRLSGVRSNHLSYEPIIGGQENKQRERVKQQSENS